MSETTKELLREALLSIAGPSSSDDRRAATARVRQALLDYGSETDDNSSAAERILVGDVALGTRRRGWGLRLAGAPVALSAIINSAEGSPMPEQVRADFPQLTQEDWDATLRVACLVFLALEGQEPG